ncbi:50S ribosomal protein L30e [Sulfolobus sp. A20-N-G8]|nr:50S ribosomal protein L30e [Sulfolobus sp. A20-N-G8]
MVFGSRKVLKYTKIGKLKMIIIASTLRGDLKEDIKHYAKISNIPLYEYNGSGWDLGTVCGKPFMISAIGIIEEGDSRILELSKKG